MSLAPEHKRLLLEAIIQADSLSAQDQRNLVSMIPGMDGGNNGNFFEKGKLMVELAGDAISEGLAIGPDGDIWVYQNGVYSPAPDVVEFRTTRLLGNAWTRNRAAEVDANLRARKVLPELPEIPDSEVINVANGIYHWSTGTFLEHKPEYELTAQLAVSYDAEATCPTFAAWLAKVVPADALQTTWEALGYALMFGNPLQRAILLHGPRGSAKSTYLNVIQRLIGGSNVSHVSLRDMVESRFRVAEMAGKVANVMGDIDSKYMDDSAMFKAITGGDTVLVEQKYKKPVSVRVWATPIFSSNSFWRSGDTTSAYLQRFTVLSFPWDQRGQDDGFSMDALYAESSGIFNVAMHHLRNLMARGEFELLGSLSDVREKFTQDADIVRHWLAEDDAIRFHEAGSELVKTKRSTVYARYAAWSREGNLKPLAAPNFYDRMTALGYKQVKVSDRFILGIDVVSVASESHVPNWPTLAGSN